MARLSIQAPCSLCKRISLSLSSISTVPVPLSSQVAPIACHPSSPSLSPVPHRPRLLVPSIDDQERTQDWRKKHLRALISNSMRIKSPPRTCASVAPAVSLSSPVNFQKVHVSFKQIRDWPTLFTFPHLPRERHHHPLTLVPLSR